MHKTQQGVVKLDDAGVDTAIWERYFWDKGGSFFLSLAHTSCNIISTAMESMRKFFLSLWKCSVQK